MRSNNGTGVLTRPTRPRESLSIERFPVFATLRRGYSRLVLPRPSGLPNAFVLFGVPVVMFVGLIIMVGLGISGSSTGVYWTTFGAVGNDPDLLVGEPRGIRSDEWLVQSSWIVSQVQQGFGAVNNTLPGGMDATVQNDLPSWDWSTVFRPHVVGFLVLPLDQGMAWRWWLPAFAVLVGVYVFCVSLLPKRPLAATMFAVAVLCSPLLQWWFLPITLWPVAWAFIAMTTIVWVFRAQSRRARNGWAALTGYLSVTMAMSIYVPFMVPAILVVLFFGVGSVLTARFTAADTWKKVGWRLLPVLGAGAAAVVVMVVWLLTRLETIQAVTSTVYPGLRLQATGSLDTVREAVALFSGPFQKALFLGTTDVLASNESEAASPLLLIAFLVLPMLWLGLRHRGQRENSIDWLLLAMVGCVALFVAFLMVPHWNTLAHLIFLDRSTASRTRLAFVILGIVAAVLVLRRIDAQRSRVPWAVTAVAVVSVLAATAALWRYFDANESAVLVSGQAWIVCTVLLAVTVACVCRGRAFVGAGSFMLASLIVGFGVNPLYSGVYDLRATQVGQKIAQIEASDSDAVWVGIGSHIPTAILVQSGVEAYNGVQTYPSDEMWDAIDPSGEFEEEWNRLANVNWTPGNGEPVVSNPVSDQIMVSFDSCSVFAQQNVSKVVADIQLPQPCLREVAAEREGASTFWIYEVVSNQ